MPLAIMAAPTVIMVDRAISPARNSALCCWPTMTGKTTCMTDKVNTMMPLGNIVEAV
ncbi:MAG: hypothetical protein HN705_12570 [Rhodospirillales bacterium]|nr:hypothetical protein [Rhodospirillales bacterium]